MANTKKRGVLGTATQSAKKTQEEERQRNREKARQAKWESEKKERDKKALAEKQKASSQIAWQQTAAKAPAAKANVAKPKEKERQQNRESSRQKLWEATQKDAYKYDAQFTPEYFEKDESGLGVWAADSFNKNDTKSRAEQLDVARKVQAGMRYRYEFGDRDEEYNADADSMFAFNDSANSFHQKENLQTMLDGATEDEIREIIADWEKRIADAGEHTKSFYASSTKEDLDYVKEYARNNFSSFVNEDMDKTALELAQTSAQLNRATRKNAYDADILAEASSALEAMNTGMNAVDVVYRNEKLRKALDFDTLANDPAYEDETDLQDELRRRVNELVSGGNADQATYNEDVNALAAKKDELSKQLSAQNEQRNNLLTTEKYQRMLDEAWVKDAAAQFNPEDYQWSDASGYNLPTLPQIMENPEAAFKQYNQARAAGAGSGMAETFGLIEQMPEEARQLYKALYVNEGEESANAFFEHIKPELYERETAMRVEEKEQFAEEHPILASAGSVPEKFLGDLAGVADMIAGREGENQFTQIYQAERNTVAQDLAEKTPWAVVNGTNLVSAFYQGAMSYVDSMFGRGVTGLMGGGAVTGDVLLGLGSAADAYSSAYAASDGDVGKSILYGIGSGLLTAGSEHISWGALSNPGDLTSPVGILKYIGASGITEGGEEVVEGLGGKAIEGLILGSDSEIAQTYKYYTANGYTPTEAIGKIGKEVGFETTMEFLIGSVLGSTAAGINASVQGAQQRSTDKSVGQQIIDNGNVTAVIRAGLSSGDANLEKISRKLMQKLESGEVDNASAETIAEVQLVAEETGMAANGEMRAEQRAAENAAAVQEAQNDAAAQAKEDARAEQRSINQANASAAAEVETEVSTEAPKQQVRENAMAEKNAAAVKESQNEVTRKAAAEKEQARAEQREINAQKAKEKAEANKKIAEVFKGNERKLGLLYRKTLKALDVQIEGAQREDAVAAVQARLAQLGETVIEPVAEAIVAIAGDEKVTQEQKDLVEANTIRQGVLNDVTTGLVAAWSSNVASSKTLSLGERRRELQGATTREINLPEAQTAGGEPGQKIKPVSIEQDVEADVQETMDARAAQLGDEAAAETMRSNYDGKQNVRAYTNAFQAAYDYGQTGVDKESARKSMMTTGLTAEQFEAAYTAGMNADSAAAPVAASAKGGKFSFAGDLSSRQSGFDGNQRAAVNALRRIAQTGIVNIEVFESTADASGSYAEYENGSYDRKTNTIRIDINAGRNTTTSLASYALLRTASHELTHFIKAQNTEGYRALRNFVATQLTSDGTTTFDGLVARKMEQQPDLSYADAVEEVVADGCEMMLKDSAAIQQLAQENKGLFHRIRRWITNFVRSVKRAFQGVDASSEEARLLKDAEDLQKLWDDALVKAGQNVQAAQSAQSSESVPGVEIDSANQTATIKNSRRSLLNSDYAKKPDKMAAALAKAVNVPEAQAKRYIRNMFSIAKIITGDQARLDYEGNPLNSVLKDNSEYRFTVDMSTLCAKRLIYTGTLDAIQKAMPNTVLSSDDLCELRKLMMDRDYEVACGICYVESRRRELGSITKGFVDAYNEALAKGEDMMLGPKNNRQAFPTEGGNMLTLADVNTTEGIENIQLHHPKIYAAYMKYMNSRGVSKPKLIETRTDYRGEILQLFNTKRAVNDRNENGGLRIQSFSDFEVVHLIDMMQVITDMAQVGLSGQAYTKVPNFAEAMGRTGLKINLSLIAKGDGVDADGNLIFDDVEGMPAADAFRLRKKYSKNVGTILVGKSDSHIRAALADPRIDFVIPFHKSGWSENLYAKLGLTNYSDYTNFQNERAVTDPDFKWDHSKSANENYAAINKIRDKSRHIDNFLPMDYWDFSLSGEENAKNYLEACYYDGRIPKFPQFVNEPGYWKLLIDFKMYDNNGNGSPQLPVKPDFNMTQARRMLKEYDGGHAKLPVAQDVVDDFVKQYKENNGAVADKIRAKDADARNNPPYMTGAGGVKYSSRVTSKKTLNFLENQDYVVTYRSMQVLRGKLYPPMATEIEGRMEDASEIGVWEQAVEHPELIKFDKNGKAQFKLDKGVNDEGKSNGTDVVAAYNPYMHSSNLVLNDQFSAAWDRPNLVVVECHVPVSELTSGYRAQYAKDSVGWHSWHTGTVAGKLRKAKGIERQVLLSRYIKPVRILSYAEVAQRYAELLDGTNIEVPDNVVPPKLLEELKKHGVPIVESGKVKHSTRNVDARYKAAYEAGDEYSAREMVREAAIAAGYNPLKLSPRTNNLSDREILADTFADMAANENERKYIEQYREKIDELNKRQQRLNEVRAELREAMFTPGKRDMVRINQLKREANAIADLVNRADKRLLAFEKAKPLQDVLARERRKVEKKEAEKRQQAVANVRERRNATEIRHKIKAVLDDFNRRLKNPTEKRYIPANMVQLVIAAEELVDTTSGREGTKTREKLAAIQAMYDRYKGDSAFAYVHDEVISDMLKNLADVVGDKSIYQMNNRELTAVYDVLKALKKQVTEAVKLKAGDYAASIIEAGQEMTRETLEAKPLAKGKVGEYLNWQLTPDKFFARLAGYKKNSMWSHVAETFSKGTEKMYEIQRDHYYHFREFTEAKDFDTLQDTKKLVDIGLVDADGNPVLITRGMMLSVYMHLSSEDNARGFMYGGFSVPNLKNYYNGKVAESYGIGSVNSRGTAAELAEIAEAMRDPDLTDEQREALEQRYEAAVARGETQLDNIRRNIEGMLTSYEKRLISAVHAWNDGKSRDYINEVTMDLYGIKKAGVENYYPIHRDTAFVNTDFASISRNVNLENWGSLKDRVASQAPILLTDIAFEMDSALNSMSRYVGYARAQRDFNKLYNVRMPGMVGSVKKAVSTKFGTGARLMGVTGEQYIENYIGDITGSRQGESSLLTAIRRNLPRATMTLNLRVGFSQLSAIPKAAAEVGWGNMARGFMDGGMKAIFSKQAREELARENVWFWQRWRGEGGQREFADARGGKTAIDRAWQKVDDATKGWLLNWCQNFDVMSTVSMWKMAEAWAKQNTRHAPGSQQFKDAVSRKYTEIIRNTQAMSSTTERSDLARSKREGDFIFTMYKSEAFANFNLLYDAIATLRKYSADLKNGTNDVTAADVTKAKKHLASAATSVVIGAGLGNALLRLLINAVMHSMNDYRDDEDEVTLESTMTEIANEVAGDVAGMVAFGSDIYDFLSAKILGDTYWGISDSAISEVADALDQLGELGSYIGDEEKTLEDWQKTGGKLFMSMCNMMGIPANNAKRYVTMFQNHIADIGNGEFLSFEAGAKRSNGTNYSRLLTASMTGDTQKWDRAWKELTDKGVEEKTIREGYRDKVKDAYQDGEIDRVTALSLVQENGGQDENEAYWTLKKWDYTGEGSFNKYTDLRTALAEADSGAAMEAYRELVEHGVKEETVASELSSLYNSGEAANILNLQIRSDRLYTSDLKLKADGEKHPDDFDDFITAIVSGDGIANEISKLKSKGYTVKQCMSAINGAFGKKGDRYRVLEKYNPREASVLLDRILDAYEALGLDREDEIAWINENWTMDDDE